MNNAETQAKGTKINYTNHLSPDELNTLRRAVGWDAIEATLAINGLKNTAYIIAARDGEKAVGMARVITDYGYVVYIADVIVMPEYQGQGIGREIMSKVMTYINDNISVGQGKYIALMAAKGKEAFYEKFGLISRPTDNLGCGMSVWLFKKGEA